MLHSVLPSRVGPRPAILTHSSEGWGHGGTPMRFSNWTTPQGLVEREEKGVRKYMKRYQLMNISFAKFGIVQLI